MQRRMNIGSGGRDLESQGFVEGSDHSMSDGGDRGFHLAPAEFVCAYESGTSRSIMWQVKMYEAASKGDWKAAEIVLQKDPDVFRERITERGDRAIHVAAATKQTKFVRELVREMNAEDLLLENDYGNTAFIYAAVSGIVEIAAVMREKNPSLVTIPGEDGRTPIYVASSYGNTDMVLYLYQFTRRGDLSTDEWFDLLLATIEKKMYDVALKILGDYKSLACMTRGKESPLGVLARHDISDISRSKEIFLETLVSVFAVVPCLSWLKRICKQPLMRKRARLLAQMICEEIEAMEHPRLFHKLFTDSPVLHEAAKLGNVGFINMLTRRYPDLIFKLDSNRHTIFHIAVLYRQERVFSLIHKIGSMKDWIMRIQDNDGNNILHLAQKLAAEKILKNVPGTALQMQRELMWYKELKQMVPVSCLKMKNNEEELPTELFSQNHGSLLREGEKGMKETAGSCMLAATLTATVVFAAVRRL